MGRYRRKCKGSGEVAVMEKAAGKRKTVLGESELSRSLIQLKTRSLFAGVRPETSATPASSGDSTSERASSDHVLTSCCSSTRRSEVAEESMKFADLEQENEGNVEFLETLAGHLVDFRDGREKTPSSEVEAETGELESTAMPMPRESNSCHCLAAEKRPTEAELEEFFTAAATNLQKQFTDKYNYDIVKDRPLEGRYEWVEIQLIKP